MVDLGTSGAPARRALLGRPGGQHRSPLAPARGRRIVVRQRRLRDRDAAQPGARREPAPAAASATSCSTPRAPARSSASGRRPRPERCASTSTTIPSRRWRPRARLAARQVVAVRAAARARHRARPQPLLPLPVRAPLPRHGRRHRVARSVQRAADREALLPDRLPALSRRGARRACVPTRPRSWRGPHRPSRASRRCCATAPPPRRQAPAARTVAIAAATVEPDVPSVTRIAAPAGGGEVTELRIATRERQPQKLALDPPRDRVRRRRRPWTRRSSTSSAPGPGWNTYTSLPFTVAGDDLLICRFRMPFRQAGGVTIARADPGAIDVAGTSGSRRRRSARTACCSTRAGGRARSSATRPFRDWHVAGIDGQGHQVGTAAQHREPARHGLVGRRGREDLRRRRDRSPACSAPARRTTSVTPGRPRRASSTPITPRPPRPRGGFGGLWSMNRFHILDPIPFSRGLRVRPGDLALDGDDRRRRRDRLLVRPPRRADDLHSSAGSASRPTPGRRPDADAADAASAPRRASASPPIAVAEHDPARAPATSPASAAR